MTFPEFQRGRFKKLLIRELRGCETREKQSRETIVQPWGKVLVPHQWIHITISLSCFADTETLTRWVWCAAHKQCRPQTSWNQKVDDADSHLPHHQPIRRTSKRWSRPLWTITIKLLTTLSKLGHTVLRALAHCGPLCLAKQQSYSFLLHPKLCLWDLMQCQGTEARFSFSSISLLFFWLPPCVTSCSGCHQKDCSNFKPHIQEQPCPEGAWITSPGKAFLEASCKPILATHWGELVNMHDPNPIPGKRVILPLDQSRPPLELRMLCYTNYG